MKPEAVLDQWIKLDQADGMQVALRKTRQLTIASLLLLAAMAVIGFATGYKSFFIPWPSIAIGWCIAERNALQSRMAYWPTARKYIDWDRVRADRSLIANGHH